MKRTFTSLCVLLLLALSAQVYAQATCGGPCGGFTGGSQSITVNTSTPFSTTYTSNFTWSVSSGLTIVSTSGGTIYIKGTTTGTNRQLCLTYNSAGTVCSVCKTINVIPECPPSLTVGFDYEPGIATLKATTQWYPGYSYTWYVNGTYHSGPVSGLSQISWVNPGYSDIFEVYVFMSNGTCASSSTCKRVMFTGNGASGVVDDGNCQMGVERKASPDPVAEAPETRLKNKRGATWVFPNPARHQVTLTFENAASHAFEIVDASGTVVHAETVTGTEYTADVSKLKKGEYYVRQRNASGKEIVSRLLIE